MPRPKSLLTRSSVDYAQRAHRCQHVSSHHIQTGEKRLKVSVARTVEYFCISCALAIIEADMETLQRLRQELTE